MCKQHLVPVLSYLQLELKFEEPRECFACCLFQYFFHGLLTKFAGMAARRDRGTIELVPVPDFSQVPCVVEANTKFKREIMLSSSVSTL